MKLNSAQHARSAASRLDDVIDRSALEQAREGLGGRDIEEPLIGLEVQKSTLEWCETVVSPLRKEPQRLIYYESSSLCSGTYKIRLVYCI